MGAGVSGFGEATPSQMSLFSEDAGADARDRSELGRVTDRLKDRFGDAVVGYGRELRFRGRTTGTAPMHKEDE